VKSPVNPEQSRLISDLSDLPQRKTQQSLTRLNNDHRRKLNAARRASAADVANEAVVVIVNASNAAAHQRARVAPRPSPVPAALPELKVKMWTLAILKE
jgi:hypothetical protein